MALRLGRFVKLGESVVLQEKPHAQTNQLLGQPVVAVDVDLQRERRPGLQANMNETKLRIEEVIVEHTLLAWLGDEPWSLVAWHQRERVARFLRAEDADEPTFDALLADQTFVPMVLFEGAVSLESYNSIFYIPNSARLYKSYTNHYT